jgi:hypothetical protein
MSDLLEMYSIYGSLGLDQGFTDLLAIVKDNPREPMVAFDASNILPRYCLPAKSFAFSPQQKGIYPNRLAGEGAESATMQIGVKSTTATANLPIIAPAEGWVDPSIAMLWDLCKQGLWGTPSSSAGKMISTSDPIDPGQAEIYTDNIADFALFVPPFPVTILASEASGEETEVVVVLEVDKATRKLILEAPTQYAHSPNETLVYFQPNFTGPEREPAFSLVSLREGVLTPCLINKLTIEAKNPQQSIDMNVDFSIIHTLRQKQPDIRSVNASLLSQMSKKSPGRLIYGFDVSLSSTDISTGTFGLGDVMENTTFDGYQGLNIHPITVTGISITVNNNLKEVYTNHSLSTSSSKRIVENSMPSHLYSEGRTISGIISYKSPLSGWAVLERLVGPSAINNGGLIVNFGSFKLVIDQVSWAQSQSKSDMQDVERTLEWTMLAKNYDDMPRMDYATQE